MKTDNNTENLRRYQEHLREIGSLTPPDHEQTIDELAAEGMKLLEVEANQKPHPPSSKKVLENALGAMSKNPYIRARLKVLHNLPAWRKAEIERMEKTGDTQNKYYQEFVKMVTDMGDSLSA